MADFPTNSTNLELSISLPAFTSSVRKLDINEVPMEDEQEEEEEAMTIPTMEEENESINGNQTRKKLRLSKEQSHLLEESFRQNQTLNHNEKEGLAMELKLKPRQVEVWFQNRRARTKFKQTEIEYGYLKKCFGSLTEKNRKLKKEVAELRAMKLGPAAASAAHSDAIISPHSCDLLPEPSTLTICPSCQHVTAATNVVTAPVDKNGGASAAENSQNPHSSATS